MLPTMPRMRSDQVPASAASGLSAALQRRIRDAIRAAGGWLPFDRFMAMALYEPGLGYYANGSLKFGRMPASGSDFVTAPEMTPLFGRALAVQVAQALEATGSDEVWEFGAGSGALAGQLLDALDARGVVVRAYHIVELTAELRDRQRARLVPHAPRLHWHARLPERIDGVIVGNEVLDAMPVQLLHWTGAAWRERGVAEAADPGDGAAGFAWADRPTALAPPAPGPYPPGTVTEIHPQAQAFIRTLAGRMGRAVAVFIDYGFPEAEYYHPQRSGGTLMCHRGHRADADPLADVGLKDITAHVDFSGIALAAQAAGLEVLGYTSQARFLINCGLPALMAEAGLAEAVAAQRLIAEHEMGELFKVIVLARGTDFDPVGLRLGDRSHRL
ncbi:MAG: SAM-dependent methyltransferase [Proteobacteria bacterium]|nr:SAM-dependent methyltransferase [Pseudomonadota bacterium]